MKYFMILVPARRMLVMLMLSGLVFTQCGSTNTYKTCSLDNIVFSESTGRWSISANNLSLKTVLEAITVCGNLKIFAYGSIETPVTLTLQHASLSDVVSRLLRDFNYALEFKTFYTADHFPKHRTVTRLWIYNEQTRAESHNVISIPNPTTIRTEIENKSESESLASNSRIPLSTADDVTMHLVSKLNHIDIQVKETAIYQLSEIGNNEAIELLRGVLYDNNPRAREAAINALADVASEHALAVLAANFEYAAPDQREQILHALSNFAFLESQHFSNIIEQSIHDPNSNIQELAIETLGQTKKEIAIPFLSRFIGGANINHKLAAARALANIDEARALALLEHELTQSTDPLKHQIEQLIRELTE